VFWSEVSEKIAALFGLLAIRTPVVMSIENVLDCVEPVLDDAPGNVFRR
jgi:hypothetical protein